MKTLITISIDYNNTILIVFKWLLTKEFSPEIFANNTKSLETVECHQLNMIFKDKRGFKVTNS